MSHVSDMPRAKGGTVKGHRVSAKGQMIWVKKQGTDDVPAILTAGEIVIPKNKAEKVKELLKEAHIDLPGLRRGGKVKRIRKKNINANTNVQSVRQSVNIHIGEKRAKRKRATRKAPAKGYHSFYPPLYTQPMVIPTPPLSAPPLPLREMNPPTAEHLKSPTRIPTDVLKSVPQTPMRLIHNIPPLTPVRQPLFPAHSTPVFREETPHVVREEHLEEGTIRHMNNGEMRIEPAQRSRTAKEVDRKNIIPTSRRLTKK